MARILIVDDERDVVTLLRFLLERDGHEVSAAFNGEEALGSLGVEPADPGAPLPDLIVLDVMMPIMDGFTLASRLLQNARTAALPILLMTAKGGLRQPPQECPNITARLDKPFDPGKFRALVAELAKAARTSP